MLLKNRVLRMIPVLLIALAATCILGADALAESKIGYIDSYRIRKEFAEFKEAQTKFDKEVAVWQAELDSMRQDLEFAAEEYQRQRLILSEDARTRKENELRAFGPDGQAEKMNADLVKPILDKINAVLEKVAIENNYDYIFDAVDGNIAYAKKDHDLTDLVLEELNRLE